MLSQKVILENNVKGFTIIHLLSCKLRLLFLCFYVNVFILKKVILIFKYIYTDENDSFLSFVFVWVWVCGGVCVCLERKSGRQTDYRKTPRIEPKETVTCKVTE
jgi:hypothetical protein